VIQTALTQFAGAQARSRKNGVPAILGEHKDGDPKRTFGAFLVVHGQAWFVQRTGFPLGRESRLNPLEPFRWAVSPYRNAVTDYTGQTESRMAKTKPAENGSTTVSGETISKSEAVRRAIADGWTKPAEGAMFVKTMFGIDMSPSYFSNIKATLGAAKKKPGRPKLGRPKGSKNRPKVELMLAATVVDLRDERQDNGIEIDAIRQVKELADKIGADSFKKLVDLVAR
jgi:hypothetical protein